MYIICIYKYYFFILEFMKRKFRELYYLESINEEIEQSIDFDKFIFCWTNWWFYFTKKISSDCEKLEKLENVELIKWDFSKKDTSWIDYDNELDLNLIYSTNV